MYINTSPVATDDRWSPQPVLTEVGLLAFVAYST